MTHTRVMFAGRVSDLDRFDFFHDLDAERTNDPRLNHRILEPGICDEGVEGFKRLETGNHLSVPIDASSSVRRVDWVPH